MKKTVFVIVCISFLLVLIGCGKEPVEKTILSEDTNNKNEYRNEAGVSADSKAFATSGISDTVEDCLTWVETPDSTCFSEIGYDANRDLLYVTFRSSGASYVYSEVPNAVWKSLLNAESKGGYYNTEIKGHFPCEKQ